MRTVTVTLEDGSKHTYQNAPDNITPEQIQQRAEKEFGAKVTSIDGGKTQARPWSDVAGSMVLNAAPSAVEYGKNIVSSVLHPIDTAKNLMSLGQGAVVNATPQPILDLINKINPSNTPKRAEVANMASRVGNQYATDYGSVEGFKNKLASDPVGVLGDASMVLGGAGGLASKVPMLSKPANVINKSAAVTNPINLAVKPVQVAGNLSANLVSAFGTHTGSMPIKEAFKSGVAGGERAKAFRENMRGNVPIDDVLNDAKANLAEMGKTKAAEYRSGMAAVSGDKTILSLSGIKQALQDAKASTSYAGQAKNKRTAVVLGDIEKEINRWDKLNPAVYHTPEGLDALKQRIGGIIEDQPFEQKTARMAANNVYHAIRGEITKQAPTYAKTMKDYTDAVDEIKEIERTLSVGNKPSVDTAMRKLQSITRNNVNTGYGNRLNLVKKLEEKGGRQLIPQLAGQALNNFAPRGLGGTVAGGTALGGYAMGGPGAAAALLAGQSPRLVGEVAHGMGRASRVPSIPIQFLIDQGIDPAMWANLIGQSGGITEDQIGR
jgi:hypothetical protein